MSTSHGQTVRTEACDFLCGCTQRVRMAIRCTAILVAAFSHLTVTIAQERLPVSGSHQANGRAVNSNAQHAIRYVNPGERQLVQPVQVTTDPRRPLDHRIRAMPTATRKLEVIHHRSQLVVTENRIRRMAWSDPSVIDVVQFSPTEISILGLALGTTDLWLWFEGQEEPLMYVLTVIRDPSYDEQRRVDYGRIERKLAVLYPNSKVYLIPLSYKIIVRGEARDAEEASRIMEIVRGEVIVQEGDLYGRGGYGGAGGLGYGNVDPNNFQNDFLSSIIVDELTVPGDFQVLIRVRIAELNRSQARRLGIDWDVIFNDGAHQISQALTGGAAVLTGIFESGEISVLVDALASNGSARILEDAQLVTLSGEPAAFLSGGEFAVPTIVGIGGAQGQQTSFRGFGTSIIATPTVVDDDLIRLQVVPELSAVNNANAVGGIPGVDVRRVQTRVELREGQTIVLGGLFSRREAAEVTRIPFLSEIPVVGNFVFNTKQATEDENELLIIVTPEIVRPMDADQVPPLPGWYVTHPDDIDFYKYNRIEGNPDLGHHQLLPYGNGQGYGQDSGYSFHNPAPVGGPIGPAPMSGGMLPPVGASGGMQNYNYAPIPQEQFNSGPGYVPPPTGYQGTNPVPPTPAVPVPAPAISYQGPRQAHSPANQVRTAAGWSGGQR